MSPCHVGTPRLARRLQRCKARDPEFEIRSSTLASHGVARPGQRQEKQGPNVRVKKSGTSTRVSFISSFEDLHLAWISNFGFLLTRRLPRRLQCKVMNAKV